MNVRTGNNVRAEAIRRLRRIALDAKEGDFLGSEPELMQKLGVSRPTLRQVLRLLEYEQMVDVKMGPRGGCYASRPKIGNVVRAAANYLQAQDVPLHEMIDVSGVFTCRIVALAAECTDIEKTKALEEFIRKVSKLPVELSSEEFYQLETEFRAAIRSMMMNKSLNFFLDVAFRFVDQHPQAQVFVTDGTVMLLRRRIWLQMANAILNNDGILAEKLAVQELDLSMGLIAPEPVK